MVIPGFLGDDRGNRPLMDYLRHLRHTVVGWGQGRIGRTLLRRHLCQRGRQNAFRANQLYPRLNPQPDERGDEDILVTPPPLPTTATCTKADGVVTWRTSVQAGSNHHVHNIEVLRSHIGLNANAGVWYWIAKKLG